VSLGAAVWLYRSRDQEVLRSVPIPVEVTLAPGKADQYAWKSRTGPVLATFKARRRHPRAALACCSAITPRELSFSVPRSAKESNSRTSAGRDSFLHNAVGRHDRAGRRANQVRIVLHKLGGAICR